MNIIPRNQSPNGAASDMVASTKPSSAQQRAVELLTKLTQGQQQQEHKAPVPEEPAMSVSSGSATPQSDIIRDSELSAQAALEAPVSEEVTSAEAAAKTEESETPKPEVKTSEEPLSSQYAQLARREKALRAKAQEIRNQEAAFKAQELALKSKELELQSASGLKDRLAKDPLSVLNELGISYEKLTELVLNQPKAEDAAIAKLQAEIESLKNGQESAKKLFEEQQQKAYQQAVAQIKNEVQRLVERDESFEIIKATNSVGDVVELIEKTFNEDGTLLTVEEAAQAVEEYLESEALRLSRTKKLQSKLEQLTKTVTAPSAPKQGQASGNVVAKQAAPAKTLSNSLGVAQKKLSSRDRAIALIEASTKK